MGKKSKWIKSFLTGKKDKKDRKKEKEESTSNQPSSIATKNPTALISILPKTSREKWRWSFCRPSACAAGHKDSNATDQVATTLPAVQDVLESKTEQNKHAMAVAVATAAAANAAAAATQAAVAVIRLTAAATRGVNELEEAAATKIQAAFRSYLARKALCALKGIVKLQALVRGRLVRKQAMATLRCMQALMTVQARARAQRIRMAEELKPVSKRQSPHRKSMQDSRIRHAYYELDRGIEENIKTVEMDLGELKGSSNSRNSYANYPQNEQAEHRFSPHYAAYHSYSKQGSPQVSSAPLALFDMSPSARSGRFDAYSSATAQSSPRYYSKVPFAFPRPVHAESMSYDYSFFPNYMSNTESSRAKTRSQSAPKQRPDLFERQSSRPRASLEGRYVPRATRMQRSSSHTTQNNQYPWSINLDRSTGSLKDGSSSTVLTNMNYFKSLAGIDASISSPKFTMTEHEL